MKKEIFIETNVGIGAYKKVFEMTNLHCPHCGEKSIWKDEEGGDYYVGPIHLCIDCEYVFNLPMLRTVEKDYKEDYIIQELKKK